MKMRKIMATAISAFIAIAMMPAYAFASSTNTVINTVSVMPDSCFSTGFQMKLNGPVTNPSIQQFSLEINNGSFARYTKDGVREDNNAANEPTGLTYGIFGKNVEGADGFIPNAFSANEKNASIVLAFFHENNEVSDEYIQLESITLKEKKARISITPKKSLIDGDTMVIYMNLKADGEESETVSLEFDGEDSIFSDHNNPVANVAIAKTKAYITGTVNTYGMKNDIKGARINIEELSSKAITGDQVMKFMLPKGIEWTDKSVLGGSMLDRAFRDKTLSDAWRVDGEYDDTGEYKIDGNILYINMKYGGDNSQRDILYIDPVFDITKKADKGNIRVEIKSIKSDGKSIDDVISGAVSEYKGDKTPNPQDNAPKESVSKFVIGQMAFDMDGQTYNMDVIPYLDNNNRTMVPIRFVANALGVKDENIRYNNLDRVAEIKSGEITVKIRTGEQALHILKGDPGNLSDNMIPMDTAAVNRNGRIYVPARFIAEALGASVNWDEATRTVTITK